MTSLTRAFKRRALMASDGEFIQYGEHLESARTNRALHQEAENTDALFEALVTHRHELVAGTTSTTKLAFVTDTLTLTSGDMILTLPGVVGDGSAAATVNTVTAAQINALGALASNSWVVAEVDRAAGAIIGLHVYVGHVAYQGALQADPGAALDLIPLAYFDGTRLYFIPLKVWMSSGEEIRNGLRQYVSQAELDLVHDNQVQNLNVYMTSDRIGGVPVRFTWNAGTGRLSWDGTWRIKGRVSTTAAARGPFDNTVAAGYIDIAAQGEIAYVVLDRSDAVPGLTPQTAATVPNGDRDNGFIFALWGDDDQLYLWNGTVIPSGSSVPLGGTAAGVAWYLHGLWDGTTASMPLATDNSGARDLVLDYSPVSPAEYIYGGHHIMVYVNGILAKGGPGGTLAEGDRYKEFDDGAGVGTTIQWLSDPTGASTPGNVPINIPGATDHIEIYLPMGSGAGTPGRWQSVQLLEVSAPHLEVGVGGAVASFSGTVAKAPGGASPHADWFGLADHVGFRIIVTHDDGAGGSVETSTGDGAGNFVSTGGVDDGNAGTSYDPLSGTFNLVFNAGNKRVTQVTYYYLTAPNDEAHRVEGVTAPDNILPLLVIGGIVASSYYSGHPGDDRSVLVLDATVAGGVSSLTGMSGAVALVAGAGIVVSVDTPGAGDLQVKAADTVPLTGAGNGPAAGDSLQGAFAGPLAAPSAGNPFVTEAQTAVAATTDDKAGLQGIITADPDLSAKLPMLGLGALASLLRSHGVTTYVQADTVNVSTSTGVRVQPAGAILQPQVDASRNLDLHAVIPTAVLNNTLAGNVTGPALAASGGEWVWTYLKEQAALAATFELSAVNDRAWLGYSKRGPARISSPARMMAHPDFTELGGGVNPKAGVPIGCFLSESATSVFSGQEFNSDTGVLELPAGDNSGDPFKFYEGQLNGTTKRSAVSGQPGYLGLNGEVARPLLPLDENSRAKYVKGVRIRILWLPTNAAERFYGYFLSGDTSTDSADFHMTEVYFSEGSVHHQSQQIYVPLPTTDNLSSGIPEGTLRYHFTTVGGSGSGGTITMYLEAVHFRPGFWGAT